MYPSYLIYLRAWGEYEATYSFNGNIEATSAVSFRPDVTRRNYLLNAADGAEPDIDFRSGDFSDFELTGHDRDHGSLVFWTFQASGIEIEVGIKIPVFLSMEFQSVAAGSASKYSYYYAKEEHGIAYLNPNYRWACSMEYCDELRSMSACDSQGWCPISMYDHCH